MGEGGDEISKLPRLPAALRPAALGAPGQHRPDPEKYRATHQRGSWKGCNRYRPPSRVCGEDDRARPGRILFAHGMVYTHASVAVTFGTHSGSDVLARFFIRNHGHQRRRRVYVERQRTVHYVSQVSKIFELPGGSYDRAASQA